MTMPYGNKCRWKGHRWQLVDFWGMKDSGGAGMEWTDGLQGSCGPWGLTLKGQMGRENQQAQSTQKAMTWAQLQR